VWVWAQNFQIFKPSNSDFNSFIQIQEHLGLAPKPSEVAYTLHNPIIGVYTSMKFTTNDLPIKFNLLAKSSKKSSHCLLKSGVINNNKF